MNYKSRSCGKKQKFYSEKEARVHIHHLKMKHKKNANEGTLDFYSCQYCGLYHIGHMPKWLEANLARIEVNK